MRHSLQLSQRRSLLSSEGTIPSSTGHSFNRPMKIFRTKDAVSNVSVVSFV